MIVVDNGSRDESISMVKANFPDARLIENNHNEGFVRASNKGIYNAADLFVYPLLYEGFSTSLLEAMACGVPRISSNVSSLPEVAGDAGMLVNLYDIDELSQTMYKVLMDEELRQELRQKGLQRAQEFSKER
jgi:glycosyltransferase involved in cell wall biosynthesis